MANLKLLKRIADSNIFTRQDDTSAFFYEAGMMIDADGGYRAYNPDGKSGLDFLGNAGKPGNWWALVTDNGKPSGKPLIQKDTDPAPGFYISTTSLEDTTKAASDPTRYVDSASINFFVLPGGLNLGEKLGDFGVIINPQTSRWDYAIYADVGPRAKIGEGSVGLAKSLGIPSSPRTGGVGHGIVYIIFPGTSKGWPLTQPQIDQYGATLFNTWGGLEKAKDCFSDIDWGG
jgi:Fungal chitosanase of glycosyl hydrolase group 75